MWTRDDSALALLDTSGGPFDGSAGRAAIARGLPGLTDASFGARHADGTQAAVGVLTRRGHGESIPGSGYGGIVSTRPLASMEISAFLSAARRTRLLRSLIVRTVNFDSEPPDGSRLVAMASVMRLHDEDHTARYSRLARRSIRKAESAGCVVSEDAQVDTFLSLYAAASRDWGTHYPDALLRAIWGGGLTTIHVVRLSDEPVAALLTLRGASHWMCWLAAQTPRGRALAASYLAYDALFDSARTAGVTVVNLGANAPGSGGAQFKQHLGAVTAPMTELASSAPGARAAPALAAGGRKQRPTGATNK